MLKQEYYATPLICVVNNYAKTVRLMLEKL